MNDNYGELAYQYYAKATNWKSLITGDDLPAWTELKPEIQAAWTYSARSVIHRATCWVEKPEEFVACDRTANHQGPHSWEPWSE